MRSRLRSGVLLAGGASTRFGGQPKGLMAFHGGRLTDRPLAALTAVCAEVLVVANDPDAQAWFAGKRVVCDTLQHRGALSALHTAVVVAAHPTVVVCAWDMPFVTPELLDALAVDVERGASGCVPVHADGSMEPLCAAYWKKECVTASGALFGGDDQSAQMLGRYVGATEWRICDHFSAADAARIFSNVNTPDDLLAAERLSFSPKA